MLDSKLLRNSIKTVEQGLKKRGSSVNMSVFFILDRKAKVDNIDNLYAASIPSTSLVGSDSAYPNV